MGFAVSFAVCPAAERSFTRIPIGSVSNPAGVSNPRGYWEFLPSSYYENPDAEFPVVLFFHGLGEGGNGDSDLYEVLKNGPPKILNSPNNALYNLFETKGVIVLSPQVPNNTWWNDGYIRAFVNFATQHYRCDRRRIYLTGLSAGASGLHEMINDDADADQFAAFVPCAIRGQVELKLDGVAGNRLAPHSAYWALTSSGDYRTQAFTSGDRLAAFLVDPDPTPLASSYPNNTAVRTAAFTQATGWVWSNDVPDRPDPSLKVTIFTGSDHNSWDRTYGNSNMWSWMFAQQKPDVNVVEPVAGARYPIGGQVSLSLTAKDRKGGTIPPSNIAWTSDLDGQLGNGPSLVAGNLRLGVHTITANVTDSIHNQTIRMKRTISIIREGAYMANFDFGDPNTIAPGWNNISHKSTGLVASAIDTGGSSTGIRMKVISPFTDIVVGGVIASNLFPENVQKDTLFVQNGSPAARVEIGGLSPRQFYDFTIFSSRSAANDRIGIYSVNGKSVSLNAKNNVSTTAVFKDLVPSPDGKLILSIECDPGSTYGYLGALVIKTSGSPAQLWKQAHFSAAQMLNPDIVGDLADPDKDGISNLLEYAFALNPTAPNGAGMMPALSMVSSAPAMGFVRDPSRIDLTYEVLASDNLSNWTVIARSTEGAPVTPVGNPTIQIQETGTSLMQVRVTEASMSTNKFYRVKVSR